MFVLKSLAVLFLAAASTSALTTPHHFGRSVHHRAIAARVASPDPQQLDASVIIPLKRSNMQKRCRSRPGSQSAKPSSSPIANPGAAPPTAVSVPPPPPPHPSTQTVHHENPPPPETHKPTSPPAATPTHPPSSGNQPAFMTGPNVGQGTYYGTGLGACGITNTDTDFIVAVSRQLFDIYPGYKGGNPNNNPVCGRKLKATYQGKSVTVTVTDRCEACAQLDLDFSPAAFNQIADPAIGRLSGVTWNWVD